MPLKIVVEFNAVDADMLVNHWLRARQAVVELQRGNQPVQAADVAKHLGWPILKAYEALGVAKEKGVVEHLGGHRGGYRWLEIPELAVSAYYERGKGKNLKPARIGRTA
jgi:hypothetical protein